MDIIFLPNAVKQLLKDNDVNLKRLTNEKLKELLPATTYYELIDLTEHLRSKGQLLDTMGLGWDDKFYNSQCRESHSNYELKGVVEYKLVDSVLNGICIGKELFILWLEKPNYSVNNCMVKESGNNLINALSAVLTLQEVEDTKIFENFFLKT